MTIKSGLKDGVVAVLASDTVIFTVANDTRIVVDAFSCHATSAATVTFYSSPDNTSAGGEEIGKYTFAEDQDLDINAVVFQGYTAGERIIAVGSTTGVNASLTYTKYDGDSV
jgi:hypothetical protein